MLPEALPPGAHRSLRHVPVELVGSGKHRRSEDSRADRGGVVSAAGEDEARQQIIAYPACPALGAPDEEPAHDAALTHHSRVGAVERHRPAATTAVPPRGRGGAAERRVLGHGQWACPDDRHGPSCYQLSGRPAVLIVAADRSRPQLSPPKRPQSSSWSNAGNTVGAELVVKLT